MRERGAGAGAAAGRVRERDEQRWSEWMARAQRGDRDCYRKLLEEVSAALEAYLRRMLGDAPWADDCVQETLLAVHRARHTYDPRRRFRPWLFAIARNEAVDALRRPGVSGRREPPESDPPSGSSQEEAGHRDRLIDAARVLRELEPAQREALVLTKLEGHSIQEAARRAGVSESAMKTRVHRAVRAARRLLEAGDLEGSA